MAQYAGRIRNARLRRYARVDGSGRPLITALTIGRYKRKPERTKNNVTPDWSGCTKAVNGPRFQPSVAGELKSQQWKTRMLVAATARRPSTSARRGTDGSCGCRATVS